MRYYLVALFDDESTEKIYEIQKKICKKYKLPKNNSLPYSVVDTVEVSDYDKLDAIVTKILKPYKKFKVEYNPTIFVDENFRTVNLGIEDRGYINKIARSINDTIKLHGFTALQNYNRFNFKVPIANVTYSLKTLAKNESFNEVSEVKNDKLTLLKINRFEIWKTLNINKKDFIVKSFTLKDY